MALRGKGGGGIVPGRGEERHQDERLGVAGGQDFHHRLAEGDGGILESVMLIIRLTVMAVMMFGLFVVVREEMNLRRLQLTMQRRWQPQGGEQEGGDFQQAGHGGKVGPRRKVVKRAGGESCGSPEMCNTMRYTSQGR